MARTITFKRADDSINIGGQVIRQHNITPELYDYLVSVSPAHADHFDVVEDAPAVAEAGKKSKGQKEDAAG